MGEIVPLNSNRRCKMEHDKANAYLNLEANCPYCGQHEGPPTRTPRDLDDDIIIVDCICPKCKARWLDLFDLQAVATDLDYDSEPDRDTVFPVDAIRCRCRKEV